MRTPPLSAKEEGRAARPDFAKLNVFLGATVCSQCVCVTVHQRIRLECD